MSLSSPGPALTLRCSRCKRHEDFREYHRASSIGLHATGRVRQDRPRRLCPDGKNYEILHTRCGHKMWSGHPGAARLYRIWQEDEARKATR